MKINKSENNAMNKFIIRIKKIKNIKNDLKMEQNS
jgi:hypothetical protein